ncbi:MAG: SPFH domain-containing protein, partial [Rhodanobacter sp.]
MNERKGFSVSGIPFLFFLLLLALAGGWLYYQTALTQLPMYAVLGMLIHAGVAIMLKGLFQVAPNEGQVQQLFGKYAGTVRQEGLRWTNPFYSKQRLSLRVRNFESGKLKVNDNDGNPIEIAAVVVW